MSDNYKVRVKHLTEDNIIEAVPGEIIISQVTGHISVKDDYYINSATKDIAARNSSLHMFIDEISDNIDHLYEETVNFNRAIKTLDEILTENLTDIDTIDDAIRELEKRYTDNPISSMISTIEQQYTDIRDNLEEDFEAVMLKYSEIERDFKELELLYRDFTTIEKYIVEQKYIFYENERELTQDFSLNDANYGELSEKYSLFIEELKDKYALLARKFGVNIEFTGGVL